MIVDSGLHCSVNLSQWLSQELQLCDPQSGVLDLPLLDLNASDRLFVEAMLAFMDLRRQEVILCGNSGVFWHRNVYFTDDVIRAAGAVAVTVPACWYLLSNAPKPTHGHGDHGDSHSKEHKDEHEEESKDESEEESKDESEDKEASTDAEDNDSEKSADSDSGDDEKKEADTPDTSDDEGAEDSEAKEDGNTKKHVPDAKGGAKQRIESNKAIKAGKSDSSDDTVSVK